MLNPDGGKMGKSPRRRAVSMDNGTKYLKSKGRARGKRVGRPGIGAGSVVVGLQGSPDQSSPPRKGLPGAGGASGTDGEFDAWTDLHSRASSSASTLSGRLSPILAEGEPEEPEESGLSCSTSPHLYPSPTSARSPSRGAGNLCPPLEQLPQLANMTGAISLDEQLMEDSYHHHHPTQQQHQQHPAVGRHKHQTPVYHYSSGVKVQSPYNAGVYGATGMGMLRHHSPMQTIQENKPASFSGTMRAYSSTNALQSLLTGGPVRQQYCSKDMMLGQERESHPMMGQASNGVGSNHHSHHPGHLNGQSNNGPHSHSSAHSHDRTHSHTSHNHNNVTNHNHNSPQSLAHNSHNLSQSHNHTTPRAVALIPRGNNNQLQTYNHKGPYLYSPPSHAHLPASTTLPPNPAGMLGMPQESCNVATAPHPRHNHYPDPQHQGMTNGPYHHGQGMGNGSIGGNYHGYHQPHPHERLPADLDIDMFHGSLDCDVESILLHDIMDSGEEMDFNFDCSLAQGVGIGMGMGMGVTMGMGMGMGMSGPQQAHSNQSWVPGWSLGQQNLWTKRTTLPMKHCAQLWHSWLDTETLGPTFPTRFVVLTILLSHNPLLTPSPNPPRDVVHVTLVLFHISYTVMTISQLCLTAIASHLPWELNSQCTLLQVGHNSQCNVFTEQLRQSLACFVRWLPYLMAANEEVTGSIDKVSRLGIELESDSFSHICCHCVGIVLFSDYNREAYSS